MKRNSNRKRILKPQKKIHTLHAHVGALQDLDNALLGSVSTSRGLQQTLLQRVQLVIGTAILFARAIGRHASAYCVATGRQWLCLARVAYWLVQWLPVRTAKFGLVVLEIGVCVYHRRHLFMGQPHRELVVCYCSCNTSAVCLWVVWSDAFISVFTQGLFRIVDSSFFGLTRSKHA